MNPAPPARVPLERLVVPEEVAEPTEQDLRRILDAELKRKRQRAARAGYHFHYTPEEEIDAD